MSFNLIDVIMIGIFILFIYKSKLFGKNEINDNFLSMESTTCLRGLLAVLVIGHHLTLDDFKTSSLLLDTVIRYSGHLMVGLFFFLSGFGLQKRKINDEHYNHRFLIKKLPQVVLPLSIANIVLWALRLVSGKKENLISYLTGMFTLEPVVWHTWYLCTTIWFYVAFYIAMKINKKRVIPTVGVAMLFYVGVCILLGKAFWWYSTCIPFLFGVVVATREKQIVDYVKKCNYALLLLVSSILFITVFFIQSELFFVIDNLILKTLTTNMCAVLCCIWTMVLMMKVKVGNDIYKFLGKISLEVYIIQGFIQSSLRSNMIYIESDLLYFIVVLAGCIIGGYVFHQFDSFVLKQYNRIVMKKQ